MVTLTGAFSVCGFYYNVLAALSRGTQFENQYYTEHQGGAQPWHLIPRSRTLRVVSGGAIRHFLPPAVFEVYVFFN